MKKKNILLLAVTILLIACSEQTKKASYVNAFIGTGAHGHTFPGATTPFGMVQLSPDTRVGNWDASSGYHYSDSGILGFSHTHLSGTGSIDLGDLLIRPTLQSLSSIVADGKITTTSFKHADEVATPGYYKVLLDKESITCELTATRRTGIHRYSFPEGVRSNIIMDLSHELYNETAELQIQSITENEISGYRFSKGWAENQRLFFVARFSQPLESINVWSDGKSMDPALPYTSDDIKIDLSWNELKNQQIEINMGISSVSIDGARKNLESEAPVFDFDVYKKKAEKQWDDQLGMITINSDDEDAKAIFYSALYHSSIAPYTLSDVGGDYRGLDGQIHNDPNQNHYTSFSLWDTFRTWNPMMTLLDDKFVIEMINSMLAHYEQTGELSIWPLWGNETGSMIGYHAVSVIADAWMKGIRGFDGELALEAMIASSNTSRKGNDLYRKFGFIPANNKSESVSVLLESAYDDWCIYTMASSLGNEKVAREYEKRAYSYQHVFDGNTLFFRGKRGDGSWTSPFNSFEVSRDLTEATSWQYRFFVPHDIQGLVNLFGGKEPFVEALDSLFVAQSKVDGHASDITGLMGQYAHGNEPSHHMAYLYSYIGQPHKTQYWVNKLQDEMYANSPEGISGNEDCGQMSAWHIMSSLGIYPVCPGSNQYILTTPRFEDITVQLGNGKKLNIETNNSPSETPYIRMVSMNGVELNTPFITHQQLTAGGTLFFELSDKQSNETQNDSVLPYSLSSGSMVSVPYITNSFNQFIENFEIEMGVTTKGATIYYSLDGSEPNEKSIKYENPFVLTNSTRLKMKAIKEGYTSSKIHSVEINQTSFLPSLNHQLQKNGVYYQYFEGHFSKVADLDGQEPIKAGYLQNFSISEAQQEDHFGFKYNTYIEIPEDGFYEFYTISDDGSVLWIDGQKVVDNDGGHAAIKASDIIALKKGVHQLKVSYIEDYEGNSLEIGMSIQGKPGKPIKDNMLWRK